jgi:hypothetical protein
VSAADQDLMELYRDEIQWLVSMAKMIDLPDPREQETSRAADEVSISSGIKTHSLEILDN